MERGYQYRYSDGCSSMFDTDERERKAKTMLAVLSNHFAEPLSEKTLLNVGASTGIIDHVLAQRLGHVTGIDIDEIGVEHARRNFSGSNLEFRVGDALDIPFADDSLDIVICSQVYEHVPDADRMFEEIYRVLRPGGVCYFAANNRWMLMEPHYRLPLLSVIPRPLAHLYMRIAGKGPYYYEKHRTYWGLKRLVRRFRRIDYTRRTITEPLRYHTDYMVPPGTVKAWAARLVVRSFFWASPGYIWLLKKPDDPTT